MKLKDLLVESDLRENLDQDMVDAVERSIYKYRGDLEAAVAQGQDLLDGGEGGQDYWDAAAAIVEPMDAPEEYYEFMDNDPDNWVGMIRNSFGDEWAAIAQVVAEYGY